MEDLVGASCRPLRPRSFLPDPPPKAATRSGPARDSAEFETDADTGPSDEHVGQRQRSSAFASFRAAAPPLPAGGLAEELEAGSSAQPPQLSSFQPLVARRSSEDAQSRAEAGAHPHAERPAPAANKLADVYRQLYAQDREGEGRLAPAVNKLEDVYKHLYAQDEALALCDADAGSPQPLASSAAPPAGRQGSSEGVEKKAEQAGAMTEAQRKQLEMFKALYSGDAM